MKSQELPPLTAFTTPSGIGNGWRRRNGRVSDYIIELTDSVQSMHSEIQRVEKSLQDINR